MSGAGKRRCSATRDDGEPCGAPSQFVDPETGYCPSHDPEKREAIRAAARKGAEAAKAKRQGRRGLEPEELPPLDSPQAAERWCEVVARAVATGRLSHNAGRTIARLVREWRESYDAGQVTERLDALMDALAEWRKTGDPAPVLELVEGGKE